MKKELAEVKMTDKQIREALLIDGTRFRVAGLEDTLKITRYTEDGDVPGSGMSIRKDEKWSLDGMNVTKITGTAMYLYTFTCLGKKVTQVVKLKDITIVK